MPYVVKRVVDPYEHYWEFHIVDDETGETVAACGLIVIADVICAYLNQGKLMAADAEKGHDQ